MRMLAENLNRLIEQVNPRHNPTLGTVRSVDEGRGSCVVAPDDGSVDLRNVRLQSMFSPEVMIVPAADSKVLVVFADNQRSRAFVASVSRVKKVVFKSAPAGKTTLELSDEVISIANALGKFTLTDAGIALGEGTNPMVLGNVLLTHLQAINTTLAAIITWGATVTPALSGVTPPIIPGTLLSQENKVS